MIYVLTGICDITYLISRNPHSVALRQPTVQATVNHYMYGIDRAHQGIYSLHGSVGHPIMIIFPTITGMDIRRYNGYPEDLISPQQITLNRAVININRHLTAMNKSMGIYTPFLSTPVHPRCRHRYRFVYYHLVDGCHPSDHLCALWADSSSRTPCAMQISTTHSISLTVCIKGNDLPYLALWCLWSEYFQPSSFPAVQTSEISMYPNVLSALTPA